MSDQIMRENLFVIAQAYSDATGLSMTTVSKKIHGNGEFFPKFLRGELSCGVNTYWDLVEKFRAGWPEGAKWPQTSPVPKLARNNTGTIIPKRSRKS